MINNPAAADPAASMPALFLAHGNPMLTLSNNKYTQAWEALGASLPRPEVILMISAHWVQPDVRVATALQPNTLYDFYGFPDVLYDLKYEPPGPPPAFAATLLSHLRPWKISADPARGLDHGSWTILRHMYPRADVPVAHLSLSAGLTGAEHYALGMHLCRLRNEGVLIVGSGGIVHNLRLYKGHAGPYRWAADFEATIRAEIDRGNHEALIEPTTLSPYADLAAPTPEHYWPLLYVLGTQREDETISFPVEGFDGGSLSMLSVMVARP